jgi:hypothetical protein
MSFYVPELYVRMQSVDEAGVSVADDEWVTALGRYE